MELKPAFVLFRSLLVLLLIVPYGIETYVL